MKKKLESMFKIFFKEEKLEFILFFLYSKSLLGLGRPVLKADDFGLSGVFFLQ